jgi:trigger factor
VADNIGEFETVDEWRDDIRRRMQDVRIAQGRQMLVERASGALAELVDDDPPEALVNNEFQSRAEGFVMQLQAQGIGLEQYMAATGQDQVALTEGLKDAAARAVKIDLALRAVADAEDVDVDDDDIEAEYDRIAARVNQKPAQVRKAYEKGDAVPELRAELRKRKAVEWLLQHVEIVDGEGRTIDRALLIPDDEIAAAADDAVPSEAADAAVDDDNQTETPE